MEIHAPHLRTQLLKMEPEMSGTTRWENQQTAERNRKEQRNVSLPKRRALLVFMKKAQIEAQRSKRYSERRVFLLALLTAKLLFWSATIGAALFTLWMAVRLALVYIK